MELNSDHFFVADPGETLQIRRKDSPNAKAGFQPKKIVIYATKRFDLDTAVNGFLRVDRGSAHLILDRNGVDVVQMVPFHLQAQQVQEPSHNKDSVVVDLDYPAVISEDMQADPQRHVITVAANNKQVKLPLFPQAQLDRLLEVAVFLHQSLGLEQVLLHSEINTLIPDPGPAFPLTRFHERLFQRTNGKLGGITVTEQVVEDAVLRSGPGLDAPPATAQVLKAGTPVSIDEEWRGWQRVEVLDEVDGNPWRMGWLEARQVEAGDFEPEVRDHRLCTTDGRQYKFIPAVPGNFDAKTEIAPSDICFIIMHATTGTNIQSTINTFTNESAKVSAHLVIGRDGRVVQMVPFNRAAFHAGGGSWEGVGKLNWHSIGIEVDNAMMLVEQKDGTFVRRTTVIPPEQVECIRHWKLFKEKPWQKFTQTQLKVTFKVVEALARFYPVEEILEHERVSLAIRNDPGPLFPMEALRLDVLKREQPSFQLFRTKKETPLFENSCWLPPVIPHDQFPNLKPCVVKVLDSSCNFWAKIVVVKNKKGEKDGRQGWVKMADLKLEGKSYTLSRETEFYKILPEPEKHGPPCRQLAVLPPGTPVRVQKKHESGWSLIATPEHKIGFLFLEGWVRSENLEPA